MKTQTLSRALGLALAFATFQSHAQVPVTSGMNLYLDASSGGYSDNGTGNASSWTDLSGAGNTLSSGNGTTAKPVFVPVVPNSNNHSGVQFDGTSDYMLNSQANKSFYNTEATLFVVRVCDNSTVTGTSSGARTAISISENGTFNNEFSILSDWALHHTSSGNWTRQSHQCYTQLPKDRPAIQCATLGSTVSDVQHYVNDILSTEPVVTQGAPSPYAGMSRRIYLGARNGGIQEFFSGTILEVIGYNRKLSSSEVNLVDNYLKCKYQIDYTTCNNPITCADPCEIDDIQFCSRLSTPFTYDFSVSYSPNTSPIRVDFGDGTVQTFSPGQPITHTYAGAGSPNLCFYVLDRREQICAERCFPMCLNRSGARAAGTDNARGIESTKSVSPLRFGALFPNPSSTSVTLPVESDKAQAVTITVRDINGRVVYTKEDNIIAGSNTLQIPIQNMARGNYAVEMTTTTGRNVQTFSKL